MEIPAIALLLIIMPINLFVWKADIISFVCVAESGC